jgi:hypothetical protein
VTPSVWANRSWLKPICSRCSLTVFFNVFTPLSVRRSEPKQFVSVELHHTQQIVSVQGFFGNNLLCIQLPIDTI